ncbi:hypothetical protein AWM68_20325 [Fictibacillus phosphorivorans]|uniref:Phage head morphogenesis domain-containing protein n=1 Tax=Fictibacillus phosphorivorans TaxID=1221500 RepID=A0A161RSC3_9BACL|nr:phage minor head protein [Fictibacillus phosphorivorans]KZE66787.1 hypothetical protein AWM68_20325 [Fictibacillus phosphorivorans]
MPKIAPPTRFPDAVALLYYRSMKRLILALKKLSLEVFDEQIKPEVKNYKKRYDDSTFIEDGPLDIIQRAIDIIKGLSLGIFTSSEVQSIANTFVNGVNVFNKNNIQKQGAIKGIDPTAYEPWLQEYMRSSVSENVSYISKLRDDYFTDIETIVMQGVKRGHSPKQIRDELIERVGLSLKRAEFIAIDQAGTILGQMTAKRHQQMGVSKFTWVTSKDERVRKTHQELDNQVFSYSDPPTVGKRKVLPGEDYRCRCVSRPVFD